MNLATDEAQIKGIGTVTLRRNGREITFKSGDRFPLNVLRGAAGESAWQSQAAAAPVPHEVDDVGRDTFWDRIHSLEASFHDGLAAHDARQATNALLELDRSIWQAQTELENEASVTQARDTLRDLVVMLGTELAAAPGNEAQCLAPLVEGLLQLRQNFRANQQWSAADAIRDVLEQVNITVEDDKNGSSWQLVSKEG